MPKPNEPQVVVITGTSRGIGFGVAKHFLAKGWFVEGCSRGKATLGADDYYHSEIDVSDEDGVCSWIRSIKRRHKRIDALINNAGLAPAAVPALMTSGKILQDVMKVNFLGSFLVAREAALVMNLRKFGRIINVSSMAVGLHEEGTAAYSASKSAIVEFTRILAKELAPVGITCNVIAPSMIMTDAVKALGQEVIDRVLNKLTIKRTVTMEEICHVLDFLVSPLGGIITGQTIHMGLIS
jgi:3-oxoacyl-[acyl-carrier protein] reductase